MDIEIPKKLIPLFQGNARYRIARGGRGSAKSWAFARMALVRTMEKKRRVLCARELQNSIKDSVHKLLVEQIYICGLQGHFDIGESFIRERYTGSDFIFKGLRNNVNEIKSTEGIDIAWVTEAQGVGKRSWDVLIPTIRSNESEIWADYNPLFDDDPIHQMANNPDNRMKVVDINWRDNPWFPDVLNEERKAMQATDPDLYMHIWEGECRQVTDAQILKGKFVVEEFSPHVSWDGAYYGADWGFAKDPTALVKMWIGAHQRYGRNCLFVEYEAGGVGIDNDDIPRCFDEVPDSRKYLIRADSARPETISHIRKKGFNIEGVSKWKGSVEDGIAFLRSFDKIVIHPRCVETAREARLYSYKTDKQTEDVLPIILDKHNHYIDAMRYGLNPMIQNKQGGFRVL